ncbi:10422_t:CDS:2 [Racocetra persica]|uniref:10422_t:CDS:1 n=1 Tax=Racocetra persica TaxID=160502 RepID=A0ACA9LCS3_9GLOM|nr:10422_t:CDS:2 [Racocetra persica]
MSTAILVPAGFKTHGIKPYWWTILFFGLAISVYHVIISFGRFQSESHEYDTLVDFGLALLWLSAALTNIYPAYLGFILVCHPVDPRGNPYSPSILGWCHGYITSVAFSWIITFVYLITSIISRKLWQASLLDDFGQPNTSNVPRRELDNFHNHNLGFPDFRRNTTRGITGQNPGPSSGLNAPVASNPGSDTYYGATIPNNYYRNT